MNLYPGFVPWAGFGYYPGAYQGFYTNGFSLYGPPVPTYAPVAGVFGGSDQKIYGSNFGMALPAVGVGVTFKKTVVPPPVQFRPQSADGATVKPEIPPEIAPPPRPLDPGTKGATSIELTVPTRDAVVFIDGKATQQTGTVRTFLPPPLRDGQQYVYDFAVQWMENGHVVKQSRTVTVKSGEAARVEFTKEADVYPFVRNP
jgi:uncharacterized protein (TIGR03000 family)